MKGTRLGAYLLAFLMGLPAWTGAGHGRIVPEGPTLKLLREGGKMQRERTRVNTFDSGRESWQIYDYNGGSGGENVFFLTSWEKSGGVENSGYIWAGDSRWRIDTPENPHSILPLILYHRWVALDAEAGGRNETPRPTGFRKEEALDLRGAEVSVHLRGDGLDLKGARCYFWVHTSGTRWHFTGRPLKIHHGEWGPPERFLLVNDESQWHRSWAPSGHSLDSLLKESASYGFSFVGFSGEVIGKLSMDGFELRIKQSQ